VPNIPVRGVAAAGILRDPSPFQLDLNAWSGGINMRFHANRAERAPIFRTVYDELAFTPQFCVGLEEQDNFDKVMIATDNGHIWSYVANSLTEVTESGHTDNVDPRAYTATQLGEVLYINRPDAAPRSFGPTDTAFHNLANMESAWTARSLRAWGDYLIALNVTKPLTWTDPHTGTMQSGGSFPNLFKWSDLTLIGQVPGSWDYLDPNTSAGENPLEELRTPIVDGIPMRSTFVIYSEDEVWGAQQTGGQDIFQFQRLFSDGGLIAPNCAVEVNGIHYCFGPNDIYRHDGVTKQSIIDKRNKYTVFRYLNVKKGEVCFTAYIPHLDSVLFCFNSGDPELTFKTADRCNCAAVYDIPGDTWSFIDLPNVSAFSLANIDNVLTYANAPANLDYATVGGSYYDQENTFVKHSVVVSGALSGVLTQSRLLGYDFVNKGELAYTFTTECNPPAYLERTGMDLDQFGSDLGTYKLIRRVFPLVEMFDNVPVEILVGGSLMPSAASTFKTAVSFDPTRQYKVDVMKGGRYLSIRFTVNGTADFEVAGYDIDVVPNGAR
jgi:hypothetical protein